MTIDFTGENKENFLKDSTGATSDDEQVIIVKSVEPDVSSSDVGRDVLTYIDNCRYISDSPKRFSGETEEFSLFRESIDTKDEADGCVHIIVPGNMDVEKVVNDLKRNYPDKFSYEVANKAALEKEIADKPSSEEPQSEGMSLS
ncbi:MAG: hypothetical protein KAJ29_07310 [Alphaproteobacteria bacterium]|nr:hypothetical protein [Alphaproteobacteria bacterium]